MIACRFPVCARPAQVRGLCKTCYSRLAANGTLSQHALPRDTRGRKAGASPTKESLGAIAMASPEALEVPDLDEPRTGRQRAVIAQRIAAAQAATEAERGRRRAEVLARLERAAAREEIFA